MLSGKAHQKSNKRTQAAQIFKEILAEDPKNIEAVKGLAEVSLEEKDYNKAETYFGQILTIDPRNDWAIGQLGHVNYLRGITLKICTLMFLQEIWNLRRKIC